MPAEAQEPHVLITRPNPAGAALADKVSAQIGHERVLLSPVMDITYTNTPIDLNEITHLIFTSQHGVESFLRASPRRDIPCLTVGTKTAAKAQAAGLTAQALADDVAGFIQALRQTPPNGTCLYVRGTHVRTDLVTTLASLGLRIREYIGYSQDMRELSGAARALLMREAPLIIPLYSARSARLLFEHQPIRARLYICAISKFVVANVPQVRRVVIAPQPDAESMYTCIMTLLKDVKRLEARG